MKFSDPKMRHRREEFFLTPVNELQKHTLTHSQFPVYILWGHA